MKKCILASLFNKKLMMKKSLLLLFTLVSLSFQAIHSQEDHSELISSGKWYIEKMTTGEEVLEVPNEIIKSFWMLFSKTGACETSSMGETSKGTWEYLKKENSIRISIEGDISIHIIDIINKEKMVLSAEQEGLKIIISLKKL
jgi:hypothetical protein